jgi:hypothetical protein
LIKLALQNKVEKYNELKRVYSLLSEHPTIMSQNMRSKMEGFLKRWNELDTNTIKSLLEPTASKSAVTIKEPSPSSQITTPSLSTDNQTFTSKAQTDENINKQEEMPNGFSQSSTLQSIESNGSSSQTEGPNEDDFVLTDEADESIDPSKNNQKILNNDLNASSTSLSLSKNIEKISEDQPVAANKLKEESPTTSSINSTNEMNDDDQTSSKHLQEKSFDNESFDDKENNNDSSSFCSKNVVSNNKFKNRQKIYFF